MTVTTISSASNRVPKVPLFVLAGAIAIGLVLMLPLDGYTVSIIMQAATYAIAVLGLTVVLGYAGQITLAQAAFFGLGAYSLALGTLDLGLSFWVALALAVVVSGAFGAILGLTSVRLGGHYLAMVTISFQQIVTLVLTNWISLTRGPDGIAGIGRPSILGRELTSNVDYLIFSIVVLTLVIISVWKLKSSRLGRRMEAMRDNEIAASVTGVNVYLTKVISFTICAVLGGLGDALFASGFSYISPDQFSFAESIVFLTMALLGGVHSVIGTALGTLLLVLLPEMLRFLRDIYLAVYGLAVILIMIFMPDGIWGFVTLLSDKLFHRIAARRASAPLKLAKNETPSSAPVLEVETLSKHFGGVKALDNMGMTVSANEIHALIGPNGSGKTTLVNVLTGLYKPTSGNIRFNGETITGMAPHALAARGLARTFQNIRLFRSMTCLENVILGAQRPGNDLTPDGGNAEARALAALAFVDLLDRADDLVGDLPYGHQRKVEIARALAASPRLLLLDEPAAGLNSTEKQQLVELLQRMKALGLTILVIEHDMPLVEQVADHITVLNFGERIANGTPAMVLRDQLVINAYLGETHVHAAT